MSAMVKLAVVQGGLKGTEFVFEYPTICTVCRDPECLLQLPRAFRDISRRHCVVDINPPQVLVRDLGSLNGTFVNGQNIGQRLAEEKGQDDRNASLEYTLDDGDEIRVGSLVFRVGIAKSGSEDTASAAGESAYRDVVPQRQWCDACPCV